MEETKGKAGFEPGKRAIFIRPMNGRNMGKIVRLLCEFPEMDRAPIGAMVRDPMRPGLLWFKGVKCTRTWIVESIGEPIVYIQNGTEYTDSMGPVPEYFLSPLDDFDFTSEKNLWTAEKNPLRVEAVTTP